MIQVLILTAAMIMYIPVCDIVADFLTREFNFKEEGFFNRVIMLFMLALVALSIMEFGTNAAYSIILVSLAFLIGAYYYDERKVNS